MKVIITGFEAFADNSINPTALLVQSLLNNEIKIPEGVHLRPILLPVIFERAFEVLLKEIVAFDPQVILSFGLAAERSTLEFERVALNIMDASIPDNAGFKPQDALINPQGREAFFSTLPLRKLQSCLQREKISSGISNSAGTYVCNDLFYRLMEYTYGAPKMAGFIHVPRAVHLSHDDLLKATESMLRELHASAL